MKKVWFFVIFFAVLALPALAQHSDFATPANAELDKFPIMPGPLSTKQQAEMRLAPLFLRKAIVVQNHFRGLRDKKGRFVLETLPVDTLVLVDTTGTIRYKADCGNRLIEVPEPVEEVASTVTYPVGSGAVSGPPSAWERFRDALANSWGNLWEALGSLLPLLFFFLLALLIIWALYRLLQDMSDQWYNRKIKDNWSVSDKKYILKDTDNKEERSYDTYSSKTEVPPQTPPPPPPASKPQSETPQQPRGSQLRVTLSESGIYSRMRGYNNLRVVEEEDGSVTIYADRKK